VLKFRHGKMTLENPSSELLTVLIRELTGGHTISLPSGTRIWLVAGATDMRKSFQAGRTDTHVLDEDPFSGHLFIFRDAVAMP
jgi:transposase